MNEWFTVITITILAVLSPGPDFAMVTRNSLVMSRRTGVLTAFGISLGVWVHVAYTLMGVGLLMRQSLVLFGIVKLLGALYLMYVGIQMLRSRPDAQLKEKPIQPLSDWGAVRMGFLTNALNPKTTLFVVSVFSQVVQPGAPWWVLVSYGLFISVAHGAWFTAVACVLATPAIRHRVLQKAQWLNRGIGAVLMAMGIALALAR